MLRLFDSLSIELIRLIPFREVEAPLAGLGHIQFLANILQMRTKIFSGVAAKEFLGAQCLLRFGYSIG